MGLGQEKSLSGNYPRLERPASCPPHGKGHPAPKLLAVGSAEAFTPPAAQANLCQSCCPPSSPRVRWEVIFNLLCTNLALGLLPRHPTRDSYTV